MQIKKSLPTKQLLHIHLTEYYDSKMHGSIRFGAIYALCIWTPVVVIMVAFGTNVIFIFLII